MRLGSGPMTALFAAYRPCQPPGSPRATAMPDRVSPSATVYRAGGVAPGTASTVPAAMTLGSGPMTALFTAYSACQPPGSPRATATADRVSPGRTVHRAGLDGRRAAGASASGAADVLARVARGASAAVTGAALPAPGLPASGLLVLALLVAALVLVVVALVLVLLVLVAVVLVLAMLLLTAVP